MDKKASIQSSTFLYIILLIIVILLIIIFLEFFSPYKITNLFDSFINSGNNINGNNYA